MSSSQEPALLALRCDAQGQVLQVLRDDLGLEGLLPDVSLLRLVDSTSEDKVARMLDEVRTGQTVAGREVNVMLRGRAVPLLLAGAASADGLLLIGYSTTHQHGLYEQMAGINNEQATLMRGALKEQMLQTRQVEELESSYLDEVTRINNELVNLQREMIRQNRELERLNTQKNELLGMAAHDLRNPLGVIMSYSVFLLSQTVGPLTGKQVRFLEQIKSSSQFMLRMVEDLLDVSHIEAGELRLERAEVDLQSQLVNNVALNAALAERKGIALELHAPVAPALIQADAAKVEQVLNNLISNAVKFSLPGTTVTVTLAASEGGYLTCVQDQGPGIPAQEFDRLFRPFSKTSVKTTGGEKSTGLGLAIVKKIVEGHGGKVWVESEPGQGSSFYFWLPGPSP